MVELLIYLLKNHNILFLDIPYESLFLKDDNQIILTEFTGTVRLYNTDKSVDCYRISGDKTYLSPEIIQLYENTTMSRVTPDRFDKQTTWILAIFIFKLLFGVHPYPNYPNCTPDDYSSIPSEYPDEFKNFYFKMIMWDKEDRATLQEVEEFFKTYRL